MNDEEFQPEYCDCEGFHTGACRLRRIERDRVIQDAYIKQLLAEVERERNLKEEACRSYAGEARRWKEIANRAIDNTRAVIEFWTEGFGSEADYTHRLEQLERDAAKNLLYR